MMKWIVLIVLGSACAYFPPFAFAQPAPSFDLKTYPDIAYRLRAFELFRFLAEDKQNEKSRSLSSKELKRMHDAITAISLELTEAGVFIALDKPLRNESLQRLSPAGRVYYEYYRVALAHNPVFHDLYKPLPTHKTELYASYRSHQFNGRSDDERHAYEEASRVLDEIATIPLSRFPWALSGVGMGLTFVVGGALTIYRQRARRIAPTPIKESERRQP
jgi:hypothetical protein